MSQSSDQFGGSALYKIKLNWWGLQFIALCGNPNNPVKAVMIEHTTRQEHAVQIGLSPQKELPGQKILMTVEFLDGLPSGANIPQGGHELIFSFSAQNNLISDPLPTEWFA